ncbi:DUF5627 domain-containing protein [Carboxylicivirga marina]|uniref:DUF1735 domain-containing protein n=1 Tax=Carboxylicivirga marina TaxID=2800988 RepID=A0ABS1HNY1_9BACT|nr:DUF5627 domain-containing protein [Carboxylicivirga marina]MBK3519377.1 DUF1735 domain-containing protein [Carboxylicivirga marina]
MDKIKYIVVIFILLGVWSCKNEDKDFGDFDYTTCYFPFQSPVRNLTLGKYDQGSNENDNNHRFEIGVILGGVYSNNVNRSVYYEVDNSLLDNVDLVQALPGSYYEILNASPITIPSGDTKGIMTIQLTEAFFDDPLSISPEKGMVNYVIPVAITEVANIDSVLTGVVASGVANPSLTNAEDWEVLPKNYTLFGIKYINKYHGHYLRRGADVMNNGAETVETVYRDEYVERDELVLVTTSAKNKVTLTNRVRRGDLASPADVVMELSFDDNNECVISSAVGDNYNVSGTGKLVGNGDSWGGKERDVIYLDYNYLDATNNETHEVKDTLVIRDRDVVFEEFTITQKPL